MKKLYNTSLMYLVIALVGGGFYREFTKFNHFYGITKLSVFHTHALILGTFLFLIVLLFVRNHNDVLESKDFKRFYTIYYISLPLFLITLLIRGIVEVLQPSLSSAMNAALSGIAGLTHILLTIGFVFLFKVIKKTL